MEASLADKQPRADKLLKARMYSFFESWGWEGLTSNSRFSEPGVQYHSASAASHIFQRSSALFSRFCLTCLPYSDVCQGRSHSSYTLLCYFWSHANRGSNNPATPILAVSAYLRLFIAIAVA